MAETAIAAHQGEEFHDDIIYPATIPFLIVHLSAFAAIWTGVSLSMVLLCLGLYAVRMIIVTAGYHRYFSHRSFKTSRVGQFILAFLAQTSLQRGVIWWAAIHRHHHKHSDTELDVHSPVHRSFLYSHVGWIFSNRDDTPDYSTVQDLMKYPELRWLEKNHHTPWFIMAALFFFLGGAEALVVGWIWSTVLLYHGSFSINSLAHVHGKQRYVTGDDSRNNWWLAIITMGEGWHNNHHAYQSSTRQGFRWYEFDVTYYTLKVLSWFRIVWDLRSPPEEIVNNERRLGRKVVEQVAHQLAESFPVDRMAAQVQAAWDQIPDLQEVRRDLATRADSARERAGEARTYLAERLAAIQVPHVPTTEEVREKVKRTFEQVPEVSVDDVAERTRQILLEAVSVRLLDGPDPLPA
ncbi:MAG TPA: fatty acid desaturase [Longimicrobiales bacterium]|nr:fatty acid desaturase [Longimicrobiales bacterium]